MYTTVVQCNNTIDKGRRSLRSLDSMGPVFRGIDGKVFRADSAGGGGGDSRARWGLNGVYGCVMGGVVYLLYVYVVCVPSV